MKSNFLIEDLQGYWSRGIPAFVFGEGLLLLF